MGRRGRGFWQGKRNLNDLCITKLLKYSANVTRFALNLLYTQNMRDYS
jgi:hypothetical protein